MTTITRESVEIKSFITGFLSDPAHDNQSSSSLLANVFRIALTSLEAEPVAWVMADDLRDNAIVSTPAYPCLDDAKERTIGSLIALYAAPPVPVIQADVAQAIENLKQKLVECNRYNYCADAVKGVEDACRAAMLHSAEPVSQTYKLNELSGNSPVTPDGWISCSERMPNDAQWCVVDAEDGYYVQCWSEGQGWLGDDISLRNCDVIRWMPIPEPPQEVNRG